MNKDKGENKGNMTDNKDTYIFVVADRSGSMTSERSSIVTALNEFIDKQQKDSLENTACKTFCTIATFASTFTVIRSKQNIKTIQPITESEYPTDGMTALFDAIASAVDDIPEEAKNVMIVIVTDGCENASIGLFHKLESIKKLIEDKKKDGWNFIFLSNNLDSFKSGDSMGLTPASTTARSTQTNNITTPNLSQGLSSQVSDAVSFFRRNGSMTPMMSSPTVSSVRGSARSTVQSPLPTPCKPGLSLESASNPQRGRQAPSLFQERLQSRMRLRSYQLPDLNEVSFDLLTLPSLINQLDTSPVLPLTPASTPILEEFNPLRGSDPGGINP